ncbi:uncharacterized protein LOC106166687 [Lingula anatina]|uniref:Uncharacterized protein LOC106166687 n=1 Tax=Lingula anatina TaxID=7574 RepID=A0A1S3IRT7_LINAN|nr:uncharacterized protein LOC106166687 [Lingula anatina]|eukprot:XP_013400788.1 uncharacterized protein LOC106166687 [Lingula anatina]
MSDVASPDPGKALLRAVIHGKLRALTSLLESDIDVNIKDGDGCTPLIRAIFLEKGDVRSHIARMLINSGADVNVRDRSGKTALMYSAMEEGRENITRLLIRTGACDTNIQDNGGKSALHFAAENGLCPVIRVLVNSAHSKRAINVNITDFEGRTPLAVAYSLGHEECCRVLVTDGKADTSTVQDTDGLTRLLQPKPAPKKVGQKRDSRASTSSLRLDKISLHSKGSRSSINSDELIDHLTQLNDDVFNRADNQETHTNPKRGKIGGRKNKKRPNRGEPRQDEQYEMDTFKYNDKANLIHNDELEYSNQGFVESPRYLMPPEDKSPRRRSLPPLDIQPTGSPPKQSQLSPLRVFPNYNHNAQPTSLQKHSPSSLNPLMTSPSSTMSSLNPLMTSQEPYLQRPVPPSYRTEQSTQVNRSHTTKRPQISVQLANGSHSSYTEDPTLPLRGEKRMSKTHLSPLSTPRTSLTVTGGGPSSHGGFLPSLPVGGKSSLIGTKHVYSEDDINRAKTVLRQTAQQGEIKRRTGSAMSDVASPDPGKALLRAVIHGKLRALTSLLESDIDVNFKDVDGCTPLIRAIFLEKGDVRSHIARMLINSGADVNVRDRSGKTALMYSAMEEGRENITRLLIRTGACDTNIQDNNGKSALHFAAENGLCPVIRVLVNSAHSKRAINVNITDFEGRTPLAVAYSLGHEECCRVLVTDGKADTSTVQDTDGLTRLLQPKPAPKKVGQKRDSRASTSSLRLDKISLHSKGSRSSINSDELIDHLTQLNDDVFNRADNQETHTNPKRGKIGGRKHKKRPNRGEPRQDEQYEMDTFKYNDKANLIHNDELEYSNQGFVESPRYLMPPEDKSPRRRSLPPLDIRPTGSPPKQSQLSPLRVFPNYNHNAQPTSLQKHSPSSLNPLMTSPSSTVTSLNPLMTSQAPYLQRPVPPSYRTEQSTQVNRSHTTKRPQISVQLANGSHSSYTEDPTLPLRGEKRMSKTHLSPLSTPRTSLTVTGGSPSSHGGFLPSLPVGGKSSLIGTKHVYSEDDINRAKTV